jgi:glyoxylase-like metal-dependent hydrolase (beta-lactamase superfamily II)
MNTTVLRTRVGITNVYILRERGIVVVDPGGPPGRRLAARALRRILAPLGSPPRADLIVLTHGHFTAAPRLRDTTGARLAVHRADAPWLRTGTAVGPDGVTAWGKIVHAALAPIVLRFAVPVFDPDLLMDDDGLDLAAYGVSGRVVHTPGHSPGSVSVVLSSGDAIVGDLAMNVPACLRPSFGIFAHDPDVVAASWRRLVSLGVHTVHPGHGRAFAASALQA